MVMAKTFRVLPMNVRFRARQIIGAKFGGVIRRGMEFPMMRQYLFGKATV
jgi:hypothetical protein